MKVGGGLSKLLFDLELCEFITKYSPYNLGERSTLTRYAISDCYLQFYYKFIKPLEKDINRGRFDENPVSALNMASYQKWLGYSFERFCRKYHYVIAKILGFGGISYKSGAFYNRASISKDPGFQFDLVFDRSDKVITVCELRYLSKAVSSSVITEMEKKIEILPLTENKTIQRVLITTEGPDNELARRIYFDRILTLDDLFDPHAWR